MSGKTTNILINSSNVVAGSNNSRFEYTFPVPKLMNKSSVALHSLQMYYSWFNINGNLYNNNQFMYKWWDENGVLTNFNVIIPDGFYSAQTLNLFLQSVFLKNGHYVVETLEVGRTKNAFFMEFVTNSTYYSIQINIYPMYADGNLPAGFTKGGNWKQPATQQTPIIVIHTWGNFKDLIGFNAGSYPEQLENTLYQHLSDYAPQISPVSSVVMRCNIVKNDHAIPNDVLYSFTSGSAGFGDIINEKPNQIYFSEIPDGTVGRIQINFCDQLFRPMHILDPNILITLLIKEE
jgi:hypothetical protein